MISWIETEFRRYKEMGEGAIAQLGPDQLVVRASPQSLSIATVVWHVAGNLTSRFTDFLTTDGEKPWRDRESEFEERNVGRKVLLESGRAVGVRSSQRSTRSPTTTSSGRSPCAGSRSRWVRRS
jgi:hypothetical protein